MRERTKISIRRACRLAGVSRTVLGYEPKPNAENEVLTARMVELAHERRRYGYRRLHVLLRREGVRANHKRVQRLYRLAGLTVRRRRKRERLSQPGKPTQNAYIESFNGKFRDECLNEHWFSTLAEARAIAATWRRDYNEQRPHSALGYQTPAQFAALHRSNSSDAAQPEFIV